jgi:hypothetical protein
VEERGVFMRHAKHIRGGRGVEIEILAHSGDVKVRLGLAWLDGKLASARGFE